MKNGIEFSANQLKNIGAALVILLIAVMFFWEIFYNTKDRFYRNLIESIKNEEYQGVVIQKYYDKKNHNDPTLILTKGDKVSVYGIFWGQINIGDSIVKNRNETALSIFRNGKKIVLDNQNIIDNMKKLK